MFYALLEAMACLRRNVMKVTTSKHSHSEGKPSLPKTLLKMIVR